MNATGQALQILTFLVAPCLGALATWWALRSPSLDRLAFRRWAWTAIGLFLLTRVGTHVAVFHVFRFAGSDDLLRVWGPIARAVLEGRDPVPYADNLYGPLFPFVLAGGLGLSGGRYLPGIDIPFIVADALALVLLLRIARRRFEEPIARRVTMAVLLSPILWHYEVVRTQDEPLFALFLLLVVDQLDRGREAAGALAAALGILCTKAVFPLWVFPVLVAGGGGWRCWARRVAWTSVLSLIGFLGFLLLPWDFPGSFRTSVGAFGCSSWLLIPGGTEVTSTVFRIGLLATAVACAVAGLIATRVVSGRPMSPVSGVVAAQSTFMVVSPFTLPPHVVQGLPFLALQAAGEGACDSRLPQAGGLLAVSFCAWQVLAVAMSGEHWRAHSWVIAAFVATWAWTGWRALYKRPA